MSQKLVLIFLINLTISQGFLTKLRSSERLSQLTALAGPLIQSQSGNVTELLKNQITKSQNNLIPNPNYKQGPGRRNFLMRYQQYMQSQKNNEEERKMRRTNLLNRILQAQNVININPVNNIQNPLNGSLSNLMANGANLMNGGNNNNQGNNNSVDLNRLLAGGKQLFGSLNQINQVNNISKNIDLNSLLNGKKVDNKIFDDIFGKK